MLATWSGKSSAENGTSAGFLCGNTACGFQSVTLLVPLKSSLLNHFDLWHDLQGRDEVLLCSLSSFDAYFHTRPYKAPRPFSFAVKSTENLSLFENTADYLHIFSCAEKDGNIWMEKILLARVSCGLAISNVLSLTSCPSPMSCTKRSTFFLIQRPPAAMLLAH